jgi:hypothetical protein
MKIKIKENNLIAKESCLICGKAFKADYILAYAYLVEREDNFSVEGGDKFIGYVCGKCLESGVRKIRRELSQHAQYLRHRAFCLARLANSKVIHCPSKTEWKKRLKIVKDAVEKSRVKSIKLIKVEGLSKGELDSYLVTSFEGERNKGRC